MAIARQRIHLPRGALATALKGLFRGDLWQGEEIERFEGQFAEAIGTTSAIAMPSGRAGLKFIFESLELEPGSEILFAAFAYPAVPWVAKSLGFEIDFVDCELRTLGMDPEALRKRISDRTRAVVVTHLYGVPCQITEIAEIAREHGAYLIEDCAHCFSASVAGKRAGSFGDCGYFSFETSKMINTLGGGIVTVRDPQVTQRIRGRALEEPLRTPSWLANRLLRTSFEALVTHPWCFNLAVYPALRVAALRAQEEERFASGYHADEVSMKGRLGQFTNYQARLGARQARALGPILERRRANAERLIGQLEGSVHFQLPANDSVTADWMLITMLAENMPELSKRLLELGIDTKKYYMKDCARLFEAKGEFPNAARIERQALHLPAYPELSPAQIDKVASKVTEVLGQRVVHTVATS